VIIASAFPHVPAGEAASGRRPISLSITIRRVSVSISRRRWGSRGPSYFLVKPRVTISTNQAWSRRSSSFVSGSACSMMASNSASTARSSPIISRSEHSLSGIEPEHLNAAASARGSIEASKARAKSKLVLVMGLLAGLPRPIRGHAEP
jgi:hypothetical protein